MKRLFLTIVTLICPSLEASEIDLYIFAGQSNMVGALGSYGLPPEVPAVQNNIKFQYRTQHSVYLDSTNWGPLTTVWSMGGGEITFGQVTTLRQQKEIAIVKVAANGTSLFVEWNKDFPGNWYDKLIDKVNSSVAQLEQEGYEVNIKGMVWIQGEGDAVSWGRANAYDINLNTFVNDIRTNINAENMPFYANKLSPNTNLPWDDLLRQKQEEYALTDSNFHLMNIDDMAIGPDELHFTKETHLEIGRRFANFISPSGDFDYNGVVDTNDFSIWQNSVGVNRNADGNADGVTDGFDFLLWQQQFVGTEISSIPEPSSLLISILGLTWIMRHRLN
jgi:hypothetical protein